MGVQEGVRVAEDLVVHSPEPCVSGSAGRLNRLAECVHAFEEFEAVAPRQVGEAVDAQVVDQQHALAG